MQQYEIIAKAKLKAYTVPQLYAMLLTAYNIGNCNKSFMLNLLNDSYFYFYIFIERRK